MITKEDVAEHFNHFEYTDQVIYSVWGGETLITIQASTDAAVVIVTSMRAPFEVIALQTTSDCHQLPVHEQELLLFQQIAKVLNDLAQRENEQSEIVVDSIRGNDGGDEIFAHASPVYVEKLKYEHY